MADVRCVPISTDLDIVAARVEGRNLAREIGFDIIDQARIATAITELARNVVLYAGAGTVTVRRISPNDGSRPATAPESDRPADLFTTDSGIEVICEDHGPGIHNLERIMRDSHPAGRGLGTGLSGTKRLMDEFDITSGAGAGTTVVVRKWLRKNRGESAGLAR